MLYLGWCKVDYVPTKSAVDHEDGHNALSDGNCLIPAVSGRLF